ncbi:hypothetical protein F5Y01DRAFT_8460 [Xylaria sp. FL0043]|nr:hypothetical protein F5Y01DRAFT_8460 [Xylaria sp. FL0043]
MDRPRTERTTKDKNTVLTRRVQNLAAALIQITGIIQEQACVTCSNGHGMFVGCVIPQNPRHQEAVNYACANHYFESKMSSCSFTRKREQYEKRVRAAREQRLLGCQDQTSASLSIVIRAPTNASIEIVSRRDDKNP